MRPVASWWPRSEKPTEPPGYVAGEQAVDSRLGGLPVRNQAPVGSMAHPFRFSRYLLPHRHAVASKPAMQLSRLAHDPVRVGRR